MADRFATPFSRRRLLASALLATAAPWGAGSARAQGAPITLVVGYPAGGVTDAAARLVAEALRKLLGEPVIVENKAGAGGRIATEQLKNAKADGRTLMFTIPSPLVLHPHLYRNVHYDPLTDFAPVGLVGRQMICLSVGPGVPDSVTTVPAYVAWLKANPERALFGGVPGTAPHFAGLLFGRAAKIDLRLAPYKGGAQVINDLIGGHVPAAITPLAEALPHQQSGRIRILAVMSGQRSKLAPTVPTSVELGYTGIRFESWLGVIAPAATPAPVVARLSGALQQVLAQPETAAAIEKLAVEPGFAGPEALRKQIGDDFELYRNAVQTSGFKVEE
ncbi:MAG: tripartite tricarboxylate transporter substrate binding protein [Rubrivivax sp.]